MAVQPASLAIVLEKADVVVLDSADYWELVDQQHLPKVRWVTPVKIFLRRTNFHCENNNGEQPTSAPRRKHSSIDGNITGEECYRKRSSRGTGTTKEAW
jgi:hypothetical protein